MKWAGKWCQFGGGPVRFHAQLVGQQPPGALVMGQRRRPLSLQGIAADDLAVGLLAIRVESQLAVGEEQSAAGVAQLLEGVGQSIEQSQDAPAQILAPGQFPLLKGGRVGDG